MNIPEGFVLVPVEPTEEMLSQEVMPILCLGSTKNTRVIQWRNGMWKAMVSAAPPVEIPAYDEAKERELFELNHEVPDGVYFSKEKNEYRSMNMRGFEILVCEDLTPKFKGWLSCAKSRARSAE